MTKIVLICLVTLLSIEARADDIETLSSETILRTAFKDQIHVRNVKGKKELSICYDTCEAFIFPVRQNTSVVWDFAILFEYFLGLGSEGEPNIEIGHHVELLARLANGYAPKCGENFDSAKAKCVLGNMAARYSIKVADVVSDEGETCVGYRDKNALDRRAKSFKCEK
jgi:hypothetical protein